VSPGSRWINKGRALLFNSRPVPALSCPPAELRAVEQVQEDAARLGVVFAGEVIGIDAMRGAPVSALLLHLASGLSLS